jgi:hypothetical protein
VEREGQPEADEQRVLDARLLLCAHHESEEPNVEDGAEQKGERQDEDEGGEGVQPEESDDPEGPVAPEHDELAVGDVEDPHDTENEGEPRGRQAVEATDQEPEQELLSEESHARRAVIVPCGGRLYRLRRRDVGLLAVGDVEPVQRTSRGRGPAAPGGFLGFPLASEGKL